LCPECPVVSDDTMDTEKDKAAGQSHPAKRASSRKGLPGHRHPASLEALARSRAATQFGGAKVRLCKCGQPAVRGAKGCTRHGGQFVLLREGRGLESRRRSLVLSREQREGKLPADLVAHPAWIAVRRKPAWWSHLARDLANAWLSRDTLAVSRVLSRMKDEGVQW